MEGAGLLGLAAIGLLACGGCGEADGGGEGDGAATGCDRDGIDLVVEGARRFVIEGADDVVVYDGYTAAAPPREQLSIGHYFDVDAPDAPRTIALGGEGYATCADCVLAYAGCAADGCAAIFYPDRGTLDVTALGAVGEPYRATLSDLHLVEVTIDGETFESIPVPGGETWCVDAVALEATVADAQE